MQKLPYKRKEFVKRYTDVNNPVTYGNGTQSVLASYPNVKTEGSARVMAVEILANPNVKQAIERRMRTKEDDKKGLSLISDKLESQFTASNDDITPDQAPLLNSYAKLTELNAKLRGDLTDNTTSLTINVDRSKNLSVLDTSNLGQELIKRLQDMYSGGVGDKQTQVTDDENEQK